MLSCRHSLRTSARQEEEYCRPVEHRNTSKSVLKTLSLAEYKILVVLFSILFFYPPRPLPGAALQQPMCTWVFISPFALCPGSTSIWAALHLTYFWKDPSPSKSSWGKYSVPAASQDFSGFFFQKAVISGTLSTCSHGKIQEYLFFTHVEQKAFYSEFV